MKKTEKYINLFKSFGLKNISEYIDSETEVTLVDSYGYKYSIRPCALLHRKTKNINNIAFSYRNKYRKENMNFYIKNNSVNGTTIVEIPDKIEVSDITFKCGNCGLIFYQKWKTFTRRNVNKVCQRCANNMKKKSDINISKISRLFSEKGYTLMDTEYKGAHALYYIQSPEGYIFKTKIYTIKERKCSYLVDTNNDYSIYNINLYLNKHKSSSKCISTKYEAGKKIELKCACGRTFFALWDNVKKGKDRCNICSKSMSNNEKIIYDYLNENSIDFVSQYSIFEYDNYKKLTYDFYIKQKNLYIEIDGEQHYRPVNYGGIDDSCAMENYLRQKDRDRAKDNYCVENKAKLIRISYEDIKSKKYKDILSIEIDELNK